MWLSKVIGSWNKSRHLAALKQQDYWGGHTRRMACRPRRLHMEPLEERRLLSVDITGVTSDFAEDFRFIAGNDIDAAINTYYAHITGTPSEVVFELGGQTVTDSDSSDGWNAAFNMSSLTAISNLEVKAFEGGSLGDDYTENVSLILTPDWMQETNVEYSATVDEVAGYEFSVYWKDLDYGFETPVSWEWTPPGLSAPLIDLGGLRTGFDAGWEFSLDSAPDGITSVYNTGYRLHAEVIGQDILDYKLDTGTEGSFSANLPLGATMTGNYSISFDPSFNDADLTWSGVTGSASLDMEISKEEIPIFEASVGILNIPLVDIGTLNVGVKAGVTIGFSSSAVVGFDGSNIDLVSASFTPSVVTELTGYADARIGELGPLVLAKAGVGLTGTLSQSFTATYSGSGPVVPTTAPGSLDLSGNLFWDAFGLLKGEKGLFSWTIASWDFVNPPSSDTSVYDDDNEDYDDSEVASTFIGDTVATIKRDGGNLLITIDGVQERLDFSGQTDPLFTPGGDGDNTLIVDFSGGNPIPSGGISFDGGAGFDSLEIVGGSASNITHEFTSNSSGHVNIDGSFIHYTGLAPILDNMNATNRVFTFTGGSETIALTNGTGAGQSFIDSTLAENVTFTNPSASLTINAGSGPDTINLHALDAAFSATVTVNASANGDTINVLDTTGGSYTINGGASADTFNILGTTSPLTMNGFSGTDTFNIRATGGAVTVNGGNDNDTFNISSNAPGNSGNVNGIAGAVTVNGQNGTDTLNVSDEAGGADAAGTLSSTQITGLGNVGVITYGTMEDINLELSNAAAGDTLTITNTHAGTTAVDAGAGSDTVNVLATTGQTDVNGGNDTDTFNISSDAPANSGNVNGIAGALTVNGENGTDTLNVSDEGGGADAAGTLSSTQITGLGNAGAIAYGTMEELNLELSDAAGGDTLTITNTHAGTTAVDAGAGPDTVNVLATTGQTAVNGSANDDTINVSSDGAALSGNVNGIAGALTVNGENGTDTLNVSDQGGGADAAAVLTATQITGLGNAGAITYGTMESIYLELSDAGGGDTLTITNTHAGATLVETGAGPDTVNVQATTGPGQTTVDTESGDDTVNVSSDAPTNNGILDAIDGQLNVNTGSGNDTLNVSDFGDNVGDTYDLSLVGVVTELDFNDGFAGVEIRYDANGAAGQLEHFNLVGANDLAANNVYNINDTTATVSNTISDGDSSVTGDGNDGTFNIQADAVQAGATNTFNGFDGNDEFMVNFLADLSIPIALGTTFVINGGQRAADTDNRDVVRINTGLDVGSGRVLGITYASPASGNVDITGLGTPTFMDINTVETLFYTGDVANNDDTVTVTGTMADDDLTVAPLSLSSALVFRGGNPWDGPSDAETFDNALPGIAETDGSTGPDMLLDGLATTLFTVDGGGAGTDGNQLYVYGASENDLEDPVTKASHKDLFGFGDGVVIPGLGLNNAFDEILVTDALVRLVNDVDAVVPADVRIRVNIATPSFVQANPLDMGLFVNSGFEASPASSTPVDDIADDIRAALSYNYAMRINGGNPVPAFARDGDRLQFITPGEVNIYSDKSVPPVVTVTSTDPTTAITSYGLGFSSIENIVLTPGPTSQTVNLLGDDNDPAIDQNDNYVVNGADVDAFLPALVGLPPILGVAFNPTASPIHPDFEPDPDGDNEFFLKINGSSPIGFRNVAQVNGFGDDQNPSPGTPSVGPNHVDRIEVTPYADDTPQGWGIDVAFDEGNPDADGETMPDLVVYNGVAGVSEEIIVSPSGAGNGQLIVNNAATGTPIVVIDYTSNTGIRIYGNDGSAGDTDVLTLRGTDGTTPGTSGNETVTANFTAAGTAADPVVSVSDTASGNVLYELIDFSNFDTIYFQMLGGDDMVSVTGRNNGSLNVDVDSGDGIDALVLPGTAAGDDAFTVTPGALSNTGLASVVRSPATAATNVYFAHLENVNVDGGGGTGTDRLTVDGTGSADSFTLTAGQVQTSATPTVGFVNFGSTVPVAGFNINLLGQGGDDVFAVDPQANLTVNVDGGPPTASDTLVVNGTSLSDTIIYTPTAADAAVIEVNTLGHVTVEMMESLVIDGMGGDNSLTVRGTANSDTFVHTPGAMVDAGGVMVNSLLPVAYEGLGSGGSVTIDGSTAGVLDMLICEGTDLDDMFEVSPNTGTVNLQTNPLLGVRRHVPIHQAEIEYLTLSGFDGDDLMVVHAPQPYSSIFLQGGGPGNSDLVQITGEAGVVDAVEVFTHGPDGSGGVMVNGVSMSYSGVEDLNLFGNPIDADSLVINGTLAENQWEVERGSLLYGTRVQIDSREMIEYGDFSEVELRNATTPIGGADVFRVHPAYIGNLTVTGHGEDVLQIIGTGGDDEVGLTTTTATLASTTVTYSGMVQLDVLTGSGNDALEVNVDAALGSDLIGVPITFDGGEGFDGMMVSGTPSAGSVEATYSPGPAEGQGRLMHEDGVTTMTVDFLNLEPIVDIVPGALMVMGTPAANTINYGPGFVSTMGRVTVDNFELIEFSSKTSLTINALAGNDVINLDNSAQPTGLVGIIVHGWDGDDTITLANLPAFIHATVFGDSGDDLVDGSGVAAAALSLNGCAGNDTLIGGGADDGLGGQAGDDMLIGNGGNNQYHGGAGFDTIGILGTLGNDRVDVHQISATELLSVVNGDTRNDIAMQVEAVRIELDRGDDIIRVMHDDSLVATPGDSLRIEVVGDAPNASDRLAVVDDGDGDVVIYRKAPDQRSGSITVGPLAPVVFEGIEYLDVTPLDQITGGTGADGHGRLVVFKPDPFENNNSLPTATYLGSATTVNVDPTIDPGGDPEFGLPGDSDWYQFVAAETGTLDFQVYFEEIGTLANGRAGLSGDGNLDIEVYDVDGTLIAGAGPDFGANDADNDERVRIPAVAGQTYYLRVFGHSDDAVNVYNMTVLNELPPVPYDIELDDIPVGDPPPQNSDTGRSQFDNITRNNTPVIVFRLDDARLLHDLPGNPADDTPPDEVIPIPFNPDQTATTTTAGYRVAVFDEGDPQQPGQLPQAPVGYARQIAEGVYEFSFDTDTLDAAFALTDGSHFISAKVQMIDPADPTQTGWGVRSLSLEIVVDTVVPPISFGEPAVPDDGLAPESDTGVSPPNQDTISDNITSDTTPKFWGRAEADTIIRLYADTNGNGTLEVGADVFLGQDTAIPLDGNVQEPDGYWNIQSIVDLNDPAYFPVADGLRTIFVTAEDVAGNINAPDGAGDVLDIFIDTQGPVIDAVLITAEPGYDLFDPKPSTDGPTPLVGSLSVTFTDPPPRVAPFLYPALKADVAEQPGHYLLVGDANGVIPIQSVIVVNDLVLPSQPATATVILTFFDPLPDDRFTLTVSDSLVDPVGNHLDGENNTIEPQEAPLFPTGDGRPGGDFIARFTVDSRPEIGTWSAGSVYVDTNGNFYFDSTNTDATNRDLVYVCGFTSDDLFAGNFSAIGAAMADGFDKLAAYGRVNGQYRWLVDTDNNGAADLVVNEPANLNAQPVAGNFDGNAANGDEVGLFDGTRWWFDTNHDYIVDTSVAGTITGYPIVGDFDGDGHDDLATYRDDTFYFQLWNGATYAGVQTITTLSFIGVRERPVAADMDQDGIDDIGLWAPDRSGATGDHIGEWYFLLSNDPEFDTSGNPLPQQRIAGQVNTLNHGFSPTPLGHDLFARMGNQYAMPIVGNFDPPVNAPAAPVNVGPAIYSVVTAVSGANPVITWTLDDADGIASTSIEIDGQSFPAYGPYGSNTHANYYRGLADLNLAPGSHTFAIYATDSAGNPITTQYNGVFELPGSTNNGPVISSVVTAVSGAKPVITWTLDDADGIASTTLTVDGQTAVVYGPYGTKTHANFAGSLAGLNLSAGSHTFVIHATDSAGTPVSTQYTGTFDVPAQAPANTGPAISSVVKAISGTKPVITWTLDDTDGIAFTSLTVDGQTAVVYGPYGTKTHANFAGSLAGLNLSAGSHTFVIHATDSAGTPVSTQYTGTFDVIAPANVGPAITNIVVTESGGNGDGVLQPGEKVLITWSLTDPDGIASTGAFIDNMAAKAVYGPFGSNYSALFDPLAAGSHTFSIRATDKSIDQVQTQLDAQFNVAVAQVLAQMATTPTGSAKTNWLFNFI